MTRQHVSRTHQQSKGDTPLVSGILQGAAVRTVPEKDVQPTQEEATTFRESGFHHNFCQVPVSTGTASVMQAKGVSINDDERLEHEADVMGRKALQMKRTHPAATEVPSRLQIQVPGVTDNSSNYLKFRYKALLRSDTFKKEVHKIITSSKKITLELVQGVGTAEYIPETHTIRIWRQTDKNGLTRNKSDTEIRDDLIFELHNAKKRGEFSRLDNEHGEKGLEDDNKKAAYALATEWIEWFHTAEQTIRIENIRKDTSTDLLTNEFQANFSTTSWRSFRGYLDRQVTEGHTKNYDVKAVDKEWKGWAILQKIEELKKKTVNIDKDEFQPRVTGQKPHIDLRTNPFTLNSMISLGFVKKA